MVSIENMALWHERDISHSSVERIIIPDSTILLDYMLLKTKTLVEKLVVNEDKMLENIGATKGLVYSQCLLLELIRGRATRMEAYDIVQSLALKAANDNKEFKSFAQKSLEVKKYMAPEKIENCFKLEYHLRSIDDIFKRAGI